MFIRNAFQGIVLAALTGAVAAGEPQGNPERNAYFGNYHIHTSYSFDGYSNGSVTDPDQAYRWARGEAIPGGGDGSMMKILRPLDWYMVSDHAEYLGVFPKMADPTSPLSKLDIAARVTSDDQAVAFKAYSDVLNEMSAGRPDPDLNDPKVGRTIWREVVETADKHNAPGEFTTFPGFEWTSNPGKQNLHRVVIYKNSNKLPFTTHACWRFPRLVGQLMTRKP